VGNWIGPTVGRYGGSPVGVRIGLSGERNRIVGNVISGNAQGVEIRSAKTTVEKNLIGTDKEGSKLGNESDGILVLAPQASISGNVISNNKTGVRIKTHDTVVKDNIIGMNAQKTKALENHVGIHIEGTDRNVIGPRNTIAYNADYGVWVDGGTLNGISRNSIYGNGSPGIMLTRGANGEIRPPTLTEARWDDARRLTVVKGTFQGRHSTHYTIEVFRNLGCEPGQGRTYLSFEHVVTDDTGVANFEVVVLQTTPGDFVTGTATRVEGTRGSTSAFSRCIPVR
jgi:hypothetical protein